MKGASLPERFYDRAPVAIQNLGISGYGLFWRRHRFGGEFKRHVQGFRERDHWDMAVMQAYVEQRLRETLLWAFEQVPYYRETWGRAGVTREDLGAMSLDGLGGLPRLPKEHLRRAPEAFLAESAGRRRRLYRFASSGSTGTPVTAICSADAHRRFVAAREVRSFGWAGCSLRQPRSMIGGRHILPRGIARPPFHRYNLAERQVYFSAYHISHETVLDYVEAFNRYRPRVLTGYASSHYLLGRMMQERGRRLDYEPSAVILSSEKVTPEMRPVIEWAFRARVWEEYGAVENCVLATECEQGRLHVSPDFGVVEILNEAGRPAPPGQCGQIVCTSLLNEAQPLIRYEIGDLGAWSESACGCGRDQLPVLKELVGRLEDVVVGPDGRELVRFHGIFVGMSNVVEGQVIQEARDRFTVRVLTLETFGHGDEEEIRRRFADRLGPVKVVVERVRKIPRTERGKFRAVISQVVRQPSVPEIVLPPDAGVPRSG